MVNIDIIIILQLVKPKGIRDYLAEFEIGLAVRSNIAIERTLGVKWLAADEYAPVTANALLIGQPSTTPLKD